MDDEEVIISLRPPRDVPRHPRDTNVYKLTLIGSRGTGKSALASRLVAHSFDAQYRPTSSAQQLFWRHHEDESGVDILVEIEDLPGIDFSAAGADATLRAQLKPLLWFEKTKREREGAARRSETDPLLGGKGKGSRARSKGVREQIARAITRLRAAYEELGRRSRETNPIGEERKRMGFIVVADVSSSATFTDAFHVIDFVFERLQFDISDNICCPVSMVLVGAKCDLRGAKRDRNLGSEAEIRAMIEQRYRNIDVGNVNVVYLECSARANLSLEQVVVTAIRRMRALVPDRGKIRASRLRDRGSVGECKRWLYTKAPWLFAVEDSAHDAWKRSKPIRDQCTCMSWAWSHVCGVNGICPALAKRTQQLAVDLVRFRWVCPWCPVFIRRWRYDDPSPDESAEYARDVEGKIEAVEDKREEVEGAAEA